METISGTVEAVRKDRKGLCINDVWYSSWDALSVGKGDEVVFNYAEVEKGGRTFRNIKGKVRVSGKATPKSGGSYSKGYSNIGVELGHAANLAMRMMEQIPHPRSEVGSTDYMTQFSKFTHDMYQVMKGMRDVIENPQNPVAKSETTDKDDEEDDLF